MRRCSTALTGDVRTIDLGLVSFRTWAGAEGRAHFANVASAGISGAIAQRANSSSKALGGKISYYWATLSVFARWQTGEMRVSVDDEIRGGKMIDTLVANGRYLGGGMMMLPDAEPDDGLFDVLLIGDVTKRDLMFTLPKSYKGKHLPHPRLEVLRGRVVTDRRGRAAPDRDRRRAAGDDPRAVRDPAAGAAGSGSPAEDGLRGVARRAGVFFMPASSRSSFVIRASSASIPRTFFESSSTLVRRSLNAPTAL